MTSPLCVRKAREADIPAIHALLKIYSDRKIVLPRSEADILHYLANFTVAEEAGKLVGCVAVRDFGNNLLEVRSLAVLPEKQGAGIGRAMVQACIERLRGERPFFRLFALTYQEGFFHRLGFRTVTREHFPEKIWSDCKACPKHDCCDEIAVLFASDSGQA